LIVYQWIAESVLRHKALIDADEAYLTVMSGQYATHSRLRPAP
jgi:hypothetical protein